MQILLVLLELSDKISDTAAERFTKYLNYGNVPQEWKLANATAILRSVKMLQNVSFQITDLSA